MVRLLRVAPPSTAFADIGKVLGGNAIGSTAREAIPSQGHGSILGRRSGEHWHTFGNPTAENHNKIAIVEWVVSGRPIRKSRPTD